MSNNQDDIIGTKIGIYDVLYKNEVNEKGYSTYHVKCSECGWETDMKKADIKRAKSCTHINKLNQKQIDDWYEQNKKKCLNCGKYIPFNVKRISDYKEKVFCNKKCAASYNNKIYKPKPKKKCLNCGATIERHLRFCSNKCQGDYNYRKYIKRWKSGEVNGLSGNRVSLYIRRYLFEKYNGKCSKCGWGEINPSSGKSPLEVHHKDGDYENNKEENLDLLCPNCHSLTTNYKALNKGKGRKTRQKNNIN